MKDDIQDFLGEFFEEFQARIDLMSSIQSDHYISKEVLSLLVENLLLKYENRTHRFNKSLLTKLNPFVNTNGFDNDFENKINYQLNDLINFRTEVNYFQTNNIVHIDNSGNYQYDKKRNDQPQVEIASEISPYEGKNQDFVNFFKFPDGSVCTILCDGVSGDGILSATLANQLPSYVFEYLSLYMPNNPTIDRWKKLLSQAIGSAIKKIAQDSGATTFLIAYIPIGHTVIYTAWLGDGHILNFNKELTGFAKLLTPHHDPTGKLTGVVTNTGILGKISTQVISSDGGSMILASDGYRLTNGRVLKHFYQTVLKAENLQKSLTTWSQANCNNEILHPPQTDDQSIIIMRWKYLED